MENQITHNNIIIRPFMIDDLTDVSVVDKEAFGDKCYPRFFLRQAFDIFDNLFIVAENEQKEIVGYTLGALNPFKDYCWILALGVKKDKRRQGIAMKLTKKLIELFIEKNVNRILLTVDPTNRSAIKLYYKLFFHKIYYDNNYFGPNESRFVMEKMI